MNRTGTPVGASITIVLALAVAACGGDGGAAPESTSPSSTTEAAPSTSPPPTQTSPPPSSTSEPAGDDLAAQVEGVLGELIGSTATGWDGRTPEPPATAAVAAIRIPGRSDLLVAVGENVDGTPTVADARFLAAGLAESLTRSVAYQLIDEGVLDPAATVDRWEPALPNADRVTVQMLLDDRSGWGNWADVEPDPITSDFARVWTLPEVVALRAPVIEVLAEPGTPTDDLGNNETVLGLIVEQVTGQSLVDLVHERVTEPAGLAETGIFDDIPSDVRAGMFTFNGATVATSDFDPTSYVTFSLAETSAIASPGDLLDLLDVWASGALFTTDRTPAPDRYFPEPAEHRYLDYHIGNGVPFNGYCPCMTVDGGIEPTAFGRTPADIGTATTMLRFADGISVVINVNTNGGTHGFNLAEIAQQLHELAAATA